MPSASTPSPPADSASVSEEATLKPPETSGLTYFGPDAGWKLIDLRELWRFRELALVFAARDLKVRYRQALVGIAWAVLQPLLTMVVFQVLFTLMNSNPTSGDVPAVSMVCGLITWQLFASSLRDGTQCLVINRQLVTKVYFPRMLLPLATVLCALVDLLIGFVVLGGVMAWYGVTPSVHVWALPGFLLLAILLSFGAAVWLSALNALYRDLGYVVPFVIQLGFFLSPVVYETDALIPRDWWGYGLNPMVVVIEGFRWAILGSRMPTPLMLGLSTGVALALLLSGLAYFHRAEQWIADRV